VLRTVLHEEAVIREADKRTLLQHFTPDVFAWTILSSYTLGRLRAVTHVMIAIVIVNELAEWHFQSATTPSVTSRAEDEQGAGDVQKE
jgi:hypothetical protein